MTSDSNTPFWRQYNGEIRLLIVGFISMNLIFCAEAFRKSWTVDATTAGQLGDFVGGYVGTLFSLVSVLLLYATLKNQRLAWKEQSDSWEREAFEGKYFDLIRIHRDNVSEMRVNKGAGRKVFVLLLRELRMIIGLIRPLASNHPSLTNGHLLEIAYCCLYFGTGPNSSRMLKKSLSGFDPDFVDAIVTLLADREMKRGAKKERSFPYVPFEGHQSRLGHYYRHLYQAVSYVDRQKLDIDKYEYVKTLRAQLSTHEQAMLLVNSLCPLGRKWWDDGFMKRYRMVKNIPSDFFIHDEIEISNLFDKGYFEWEDEAVAGQPLQVENNH